MKGIELERDLGVGGRSGKPEPFMWEEDGGAMGIMGVMDKKLIPS